MSENAGLSWKERHKDGIAATELTACPHCVASRLLDLPETREFSPQQKQRMSLGKHFQDMEADRLKEKGLDFYRGQATKLTGLAMPIIGEPDFLIRENGKVARVVEVKYRTYPPRTLPQAWLYQAGVYSIRYDDVPITYAIYSLDERYELSLDGPPEELPAVLREWADMIAPVVKRGVPLDSLPHNPVACQRSGWACEGCLGARKAEEEYTDYERRRLRRYLELRQWDEDNKEQAKNWAAAKQEAQEIAMARDGECRFEGFVFEVRERTVRRVDTKQLPDEIRAEYTIARTEHRLRVEEEQDA